MSMMEVIKEVKKLSIFRTVNDEVREFTVFFYDDVLRQLPIFPKCAKCHVIMDPVGYPIITAVVKIIDTTDTTNVPSGCEEIIQFGTALFGEVIGDIQQQIVYKIQFPKNEICNNCFDKVNKISQIKKKHKAIFYEPQCQLCGSVAIE